MQDKSDIRGGRDTRPRGDGSQVKEEAMMDEREKEIRRRWSTVEGYRNYPQDNREGILAVDHIMELLAIIDRQRAEMEKHKNTCNSDKKGV